jgi:peptide-methionine (S)-S-oxide reductase
MYCKKINRFKYISILCIILYNCTVLTDKTDKISPNSDEPKLNAINMNDTINYETAVLAGGCFWCIETIFQDIKGVELVESGYTGGSVKNPTYKEVCTGKTGHAEAVKILFNPDIISYEQLLIVFFHIHNPTTLNQQGADIGTQYRSAIFYLNDNQKSIAEKVISDITDSKLWSDPIVTELNKFDTFYKAEDYHQDYYNNNPEQGYCSMVIAPKVKKFYKEFPHLLKNNLKQN